MSININFAIKTVFSREIVALLIMALQNSKFQNNCKKHNFNANDFLFGFKYPNIRAINNNVLVNLPLHT